MVRSASPLLSILVPVYNEEESILPLVDAIKKAIAQHHYEIILIDDGSTDHSWQQIVAATEKDPQVIGIHHRTNFGKSQAIESGLRESKGEIIITMDADLQDDPAEIPAMLAKMEEGYDFVVGWKKERNDPLSKTLPSKLFNCITAKLSGLQLHDFNCGLKAFRREIFSDFKIYGELHRFLPVFAKSYGYRVTEIPVKHHPRKFGVSKFGIERFLRGFIDLFTTLLITRYKRRPAHLFGSIGFILSSIGGLILSYLTFLWCMTDEPIGTRPLLSLGVLLTIIGMQFLFFGLLAEFLLYRFSSEKTEHLVTKTTKNLQKE